MSTLNQQETENLRDAIQTIQDVLRNGYEVGEDRSISNVRRKINLERANKQLSTILTMKGNYPS